MGRPQEQTQHELRQAQPCSALLLRQGVSLKNKSLVIIYMLLQTV